VTSQYGHFEVVIPSDYESGQAIVERIMSAVAQCGFSTRDTFGLRLSVDEAVINAIKHGNKFHPDKTVRVDFLSNETGVRIEIEDQGPGFRPEDVPDPTADENLERPSGRGLMLMREFMTHVEFSPKGNLVVLEKRYSS
jgi:serine/threonine-protein kinase RsbW